MLLPQSTSIGVRLSLGLVVGVTCLMLGAGLYSYRAIARHLLAELHEGQERRVEQLAVSLRLPAWNLDVGQIEQVLDAGFLTPFIERITVRLTDRNRTTRERRREQPGGSLLPAVVRPIELEGETLGTVELTASSALVAEDLRDLRNWMIGFGLTVDALLVGGLALLLRRAVLRPLGEIERFARGRAPAGPKTPDLAHRLYRGELESLRTSLLAMVDDLRRNEARLRLIGDNLPDTLVYQVVRETDGTMRFLHLSAGVEKIHQVRAEEVLRDSALLYGQVVAEDQPRLAAAEAESFARLTVFQSEVRMRRPDGTVRWVIICSQPRRLTDGRVAWDGIEMDVTARKEAERELTRLGRMIEAHEDAACWMDVTNRIVYANQALLRSVGYTREELVGSHISRIAPGATANRLEFVWNQLRRTGSYRAEALHQRRDGSTFPVDLSSTHVVIDGQEFNCGFARDISGRKATEEELKRQLDELRRWQTVTLNREERIGQLKAEVNELCRAAGREPRYAAGAETGSGGTPA